MLSECYVIGSSILEAITIYHVLVYFCVVLLVTLFHTVTNLDLSLEKTNPTKNPSKNGLIRIVINGARGKDLMSQAELRSGSSLCILQQLSPFFTAHFSATCFHSPGPLEGKRVPEIPH